MSNEKSIEDLVESIRKIHCNIIDGKFRCEEIPIQESDNLVKQEIEAYKESIFDKVKQIVIEDVPHKYQDRLLKYIKEGK